MRNLPRRLLVALLAAATAVAVTAAHSALLGALSGTVVLALGWGVLRARAPEDPGRRSVLAWLGGLGLLAAGAGLGHAVRRLLRPDPRPTLERMARDLGAEYLELVVRAYHPERSGDLQLLVTPFSSSNYPQESRSLVPNDPRTSHAVVWMYAERVPIVVWAPGIVEPSDSVERVTLADLAPTAARLMGFEAFRAPDGRPLPGIPAPARPPRLIVTFVIDGGGWNVLRRWPDAWPNLRRLARAGALYRNAITGSFPAVTAAAHATIGTG
ncbi:MAG TPA: alkaline phosphatase family protein, partial [Actinomycetota bacterium]|nr:alkaline phosphatase family protein [Actinomycetota bacterium]